MLGLWLEQRLSLKGEGATVRDLLSPTTGPIRYDYFE